MCNLVEGLDRASLSFINEERVVMNVAVIDATNFVQTPVQGILLFANRFGVNLYPEYWLLRDYAGSQFEDGLAAAIEHHAEKQLHYPDTPDLEAVTVMSPNKAQGFQLPAIVYAMANDLHGSLNLAYTAGFKEASRVQLRSLTIPLYTWGCPVGPTFMALLRNLRGALCLLSQQTGNTIAQVIIAVDSAEAHGAVVKTLSEVFDNIY